MLFRSDHGVDGRIGSKASSERHKEIQEANEALDTEHEGRDLRAGMSTTWCNASRGPTNLADKVRCKMNRPTSALENVVVDDERRQRSDRSECEEIARADS